MRPIGIALTIAHRMIRFKLIWVSRWRVRDIHDSIIEFILRDKNILS